MLDLVLLTSNHMLRLTNENENEASFSFSSRTITCNFYRNFVVHMSNHTRQNESFSSSNRKKRPYSGINKLEPLDLYSEEHPELKIPKLSST